MVAEKVLVLTFANGQEWSKGKRLRGTGGLIQIIKTCARGVGRKLKVANFIKRNMQIMSEHLRCEMCGKQDETVKCVGWNLCPECDIKMGESIDACEEARAEYEAKYGEFDGGGGA